MGREELMGRGRQLATIGLAAAGLYEGTLAAARFQRRRAVFEAAQRRAKALGRPVVVVGDPDAGLHTRLARAYPCGDVCIDLRGCPACPITVPADITQTIPLINDDSVVVFVSCVLEYVADVHAATAELLRIAGDPGNLFLVAVDPLSLTSIAYPGARWRAQAGPPKWRPVTIAHKLGLAALLGAALYGAVKG